MDNVWIVYQYCIDEIQIIAHYQTRKRKLIRYSTTELPLIYPARKIGKNKPSLKIRSIWLIFLIIKIK